MINLDKQKFERFMYFLVKGAANCGFEDFLKENDLSLEDYYEIKKELENNYKIKLYL